MMFERLQQLLAEQTQLPPEQITGGARLGDLFLDSVELAEFGMLVEEEYGTLLPAELPARLDLAAMTVGELVTLLESFQ